MYEENVGQFKTCVIAKSNLEQTLISSQKLNMVQRKKAHKQKLGTYKSILPSITQFQLSIPNLKNILKDQQHLIRNKPLLKTHPVIITVIINLYFKLTQEVSMI